LIRAASFPFLCVSMLVAAPGPAVAAPEPAVAAEKAAAAHEVEQAISAAVLPPANILPGWSLAEAWRRFEAEDLWRHIDGAADQYLSFGCRSLDAAYYREEGTDAEIAVEIYTMADALGSFGLYMLERSSTGPRLPLGGQGYRSGGDLAFFGGTSYVKLRAYPDDEPRRTASLRVADWIAANALAARAFPPELQAFPRERLIEDSFGFVPRGALGLAGLERALTARYRKDDAELTLHWTRGTDADSAQVLFARLGSSIERRGVGRLRPIRIADADGWTAEMKYQGPVMVAHRGRDIILASGSADTVWMAISIERLLSNLR